MRYEVKIDSILDPIVERLKEYLEKDMQIPLLEDNIKTIDVDGIILKKMTAMLGIGGDIQAMVSFGYDDILLDVLMDAFLYGEKVEDTELVKVQESLCCEIANIIVGNAINTKGSKLLTSITPPILIHDAKSLAKDKNATIKVALIKTKYGDIQVTIVFPKKMFIKS